MCVYLLPVHMFVSAQTPCKGSEVTGTARPAASREGSLILGDRDEERSIGIAHTYLLKMEIYKCISNPIQ